MRHKLSPFLFFAFLAVTLIYCNKSTPFGADLLEDQEADLAFSDTFSLKFTLLEEDSILSSDVTSTLVSLPCGIVEDPIFGRTESVIYSGFRSSFQGYNLGATAVLDSVVLMLGIEPGSSYGDTTIAQRIEVHQLASTLNYSKPFYSNQSLPEASLIGWLDGYRPTPNIGRPLIDSTNASNTGRDSSFGAYIRIPLDTLFGRQFLLADSLTRSADSLLLETIKGISIRSVTPGAIVGYRLNNSFFSNVLLYYKTHKDSTRQFVFKIRMGGANKFTNLTHERTSFIKNQVGTELNEGIPLEGLTGLRTKVSFPHIKDFGNVVVNKAELELTVDLPNNPDTSKYALPRQLIYTITQGDTTTVISADPAYSLNATGGAFTTFGGQPWKEGARVVYRLNVSDLVQRMIDGRAKPELFINVYPQLTSPARVMLLGKNSVLHPPKLNVKYSRI